MGKKGKVDWAEPVQQWTLARLGILRSWPMQVISDTPHGNIGEEKGARRDLHLSSLSDTWERRWCGNILF